jgi:hypothetical protein
MTILVVQVNQIGLDQIDTRRTRSLGVSCAAQVWHVVR